MWALLKLPRLGGHPCKPLYFHPISPAEVFARYGFPDFTPAIPHPSDFRLVRASVRGAAQTCEAPKFERLPLCLWYCCMHYIIPA